MASTTTTKVLVLGNSGVGKSWLVNVITLRPMFQSKFSLERVTEQVEKAELRTEDGATYMLYNIPGMVDKDRVIALRNAAEIEKSFRDLVWIPVVTFFVITVESGRLRAEDLEAWRALAKFAPDVRDKSAVTFVINKLDPNFFETAEERVKYEVSVRSTLREYCEVDFDILVLPALHERAVREDYASAAVVDVHDRMLAAMLKMRGKALKIAENARLMLERDCMAEELARNQKTIEDMQKKNSEDNASFAEERRRYQSEMAELNEVVRRAREERDRRDGLFSFMVKAVGTVVGGVLGGPAGAALAYGVLDRLDKGLDMGTVGVVTSAPQNLRITMK